jgi:crotonobetainyl-CoA:carnitine CoA-transferase CaiB-like acyl-CoA transferase
MNAGERVYQLTDGWIFAQGDHDLSSELSSLGVDAALTELEKMGIPAVPVQTVKELADRHRENPSRTVDFEKRESDGWENECFAPSWFAFDGDRVASPGAAPRSGSDAPAILAELGYSAEDVERLIAGGAVGRTEWVPSDS